MYRSIWLFVLLLVGLGSSVNGQNATQSDVDRFQGAWQPAFMRNLEGQNATSEELKAIRLVVKDNGFTLTNKEISIAGTFTIDPSKTPKTIDLVLTGSKSDERFLGIYEIQGEQRLSCFALPKEKRPQVLRPSEKGYLMFEWKPAAP
ncbi:MAG: TIGR03067 domain-containing protein [Gemmataceae bacterium]|nr:TIGR03067 domain-containing protein [Gemmataceae bacterium]